MVYDPRPMSCDPAEPIALALRAAIAAECGIDPAQADPRLQPSANPAFGDLQANFAMALAKQCGRNPRDLAQAVVARLGDSLDARCEPMQVAGPGFINIRLRPAALGAALAAFDAPALGIEPPADTHTCAVDLCGVNVAKQMHVGHLRATIIGDTIARTYERLGWSVFRQNHLGDWGLPIAMTLASLRRRGTDLATLTLDDLNAAYRSAQAEGRDDEAGLAAARACHCGPHRIAELEAQHDGASAAIADAKSTLVRLQGGDAELVRQWERIIEVTMREVYAAAALLNVRLDPASEKGESSFRDELAPVIEAFERAGLATIDQGALVVKYPDRERPMLIRKSDGAFLYATTDLAALRFRIQGLGAERVIYCVDARQRDHFKDVFDAVRMIGWTKLTRERGGREVAVECQLVHVPFGTVLGADKKPLKTRSGENFTLKALLDEAIDRGVREVTARSSDPASPTHGMGAAELHAIGQAVGIAAVKYADLSSEVSRDYVFDLDRMVAFEGDTGPYLQYAHARIASMLAKAGDAAAWTTAPIDPSTPEEKALGFAILRYPVAVRTAADQCSPSTVCAYLYALANAFNAFYQACPVLKCDDARVRASRLHLAHLTRRTLADGLSLLGISAPSRM